MPSLSPSLLPFLPPCLTLQEGLVGGDEAAVAHHRLQDHGRHVVLLEREGGREEGKEGGREVCEPYEGRTTVEFKVSQRGREGRRKEGREGGREGEKEGCVCDG